MGVQAARVEALIATPAGTGDNPRRMMMLQPYDRRLRACAPRFLRFFPLLPSFPSSTQSLPSLAANLFPTNNQQQTKAIGKMTDMVESTMNQGNTRSSKWLTSSCFVPISQPLKLIATFEQRLPRPITSAWPASCWATPPTRLADARNSPLPKASEKVSTGAGHLALPRAFRRAGNRPAVSLRLSLRLPSASEKPGARVSFMFHFLHFLAPASSVQMLPEKLWFTSVRFLTRIHAQCAC